MEHRFGSSPPLSIGIEEELLLVDQENALLPEAEKLLGDLDGEDREHASTEIFAAQIELKTGICDDPGRALLELSKLRRAVVAKGYRLLGSGLHPDEDHATLVESDRYEVVKTDLATLLRTPPCGLHVHVGMPDAETAIRVCNLLRHHLPLLQALTANSPYRDGEDSGFASARAAVVASYPRFEMPRAFRDYDDFEQVADQLIAAAGVSDYTYLWWNLRPHPNLGTVELRGLDVQTEVEDNAMVGALVQALAAREIDRPDGQPDIAREALEESYYQAGRHGLEAKLLVDAETARPAPEVASEVIEQLRPYAQRLGSEDAFDRAGRILAEGNGADLQRRIHERAGMSGLLADLARRTMGGEIPTFAPAPGGQ